MPFLSRLIAAIQTLTAPEGEHLYKCQWGTREPRPTVYHDKGDSLATMLRNLK